MEPREVKQKIPVAAVAGSTASGKSALAVELALRLGGEVVSVDSMQVYRDLSISTARPTQEEMRGVPHHLIGFADASEPFSVAEYVELASACIAEIHARGRLPILAGGTGLYLRSLLHRVAFSQAAPQDEALRRELTAYAEREGCMPLWEELNRLDPETAARLHPNDVGRVIRAIEVCRATGSTMAEQQRLSRTEESPYHACVLVLSWEDRQALYERINRRVDAMLEAGLEDEARRFLQSHPKTAAQAIGCKELAPYFNGKCSREEAVENLKRETRRYAKRQLTWFRREEGAHWIDMQSCGGLSGAAEQALAIVRGELGTITREERGAVR